MLRRLSPRGELLLINVLCFGPFAAMSIAGAVEPRSSIVIDDRYVAKMVILELVCGTIAALILRARGWTLRDLGLKFSMPLTIGGMVLFIAANVTIASMYKLFVLATGLDPGNATKPVPSVSWLALIVFLLVDPLYEETFEVAYNLRALENTGPAFAISLSAAIRFVCHLYQGPITALTILPLGIILAAVYWKTRRVWPLAVAHAMGGYFMLAPQG